MICKICQSEEVMTKKESDIYTDNILICHCLSCGIKYLLNFPTQEDLDKLYTKEYFNGRGYKNYINDEKTIRLNARRYIKIILKYLKLDIFTSHWLDYGCAYGFLMDEVRNEGVWVDGIEICDDAIHYADTKLDLVRIIKSINGYKSNLFDACTIIGTLEHLINPTETLKKINEMLVENGYLLLTVPRYDGFWPLKWRGNEHLWYFDKQAIGVLLYKCGFRIIFCKNHWMYYEIEDALNKATTYFKLPFNNRWIVWICKKLIPRIKIPNNELICLVKKQEQEIHSGLEIMMIKDMA